MGFLGLYFSVPPTSVGDRLYISRFEHFKPNVSHVRGGQTNLDGVLLGLRRCFPCAWGTDCAFILAQSKNKVPPTNVGGRLFSHVIFLKK